VAEVVELEGVVGRGAVEADGRLRLQDRVGALLRRVAGGDDHRDDQVDRRRVAARPPRALGDAGQQATQCSI